MVHDIYYYTLTSIEIIILIQDLFNHFMNHLNHVEKIKVSFKFFISILHFYKLIEMRGDLKIHKHKSSETVIDLKYLFIDWI